MLLAPLAEGGKDTVGADSISARRPCRSRTRPRASNARPYPLVLQEYTNKEIFLCEQSSSASPAQALPSTGASPGPSGPGLVILLGVRDTDDSAIVPKLAEKCAHLRIFEDEDGKLNRSAVELGYSALVVSNFTLYGDTSRGKRRVSSMPPGASWPCRAMKNSSRR